MASKTRAGFPRQSSPDTRTLVSTTALTSAPFVPDDIHFGLDGVHAHAFAGLAAHLLEHVAELLSLARAMEQFAQPLDSKSPLARASRTRSSGKSS